MTQDVESPIAPASERKLRFDDKSLRDYATRYTDDRTHEPTVWLGRYVRNKCNSSLNVLADKVKSLGQKGSYETFHKILTGKAFNTKESIAAGSVENFIRLVDVLKKRELLEDMVGKVPFVETWTSRTIMNYIQMKCGMARVCKFGVIVGWTGQQKTATFKKICVEENNPISSEDEQPTSSGKVFCVHMEAPFKPSMPQFICELAQRFGLSREQAKRDGMDHILNQVTAETTIIIDNVQRLYRLSGRSSRDTIHSLNQPIFNFLQKIQDDTGCTIILSFTPDFLTTLTEGINAGYFEQFEGRAGGRDQFLVLPDYINCQGEVRKQLLEQDIIPIAQAFGMVHAEKHGAYLESLVRRPGRIRILFNALQNARQIANAMNLDKLTIEVLQQAVGEKKGTTI